MKLKGTCDSLAIHCNTGHRLKQAGCQILSAEEVP